MGVIAAIMPFAIRNYYVAGDPAMTNAASGIHFYIGNHRGAWGGYSRVEGVRPNPAGHFYDARRLAEEEMGDSLSASQVSSLWRYKALSFMREDPGAFFRLLGNKVLLLLSSYEVPNNENYQYLAQRSFSLSLLPAIGFLLPVGLCGLVYSLPQWRKLTPLLILFLSYSIGVILTLVTWRYRLPLTLVLWPLTAFFMVKSSELIRERRFPVLILCIFLLIGFWALSKASPVKKQRNERDLKKAHAKMKMSRQEGAILEQISFYSDSEKFDNSLLRLSLAEMRQRLYDFEGARKIVLKAIAVNPDEPLLWQAICSVTPERGDVRMAKEIEECKSRGFKAKDERSVTFHLSPLSK
jgi:hypothetical protein